MSIVTPSSDEHDTLSDTVRETIAAWIREYSWDTRTVNEVKSANFYRTDNEVSIYLTYTDSTASPECKCGHDEAEHGVEVFLAEGEPTIEPGCTALVEKENLFDPADTVMHPCDCEQFDPILYHNEHQLVIEGAEFESLWKAVVSV